MIRAPRARDWLRTFLAKRSMRFLIAAYLAVMAAVALAAATAVWLTEPASSGPHSLERLGYLVWAAFAALHDYAPDDWIGSSGVHAAVVILLALMGVFGPTLLLGSIVFKLLVAPGRIIEFRPQLMLKRHEGVLTLEACSYSRTGLAVEDLSFTAFVRYECRRAVYPIVTKEIPEADRKQLPIPFNILPTRSSNVRVAILPDRNVEALPRWQQFPLVLRRSPEGFELLAICGDKDFTPDSGELIVRVKGYLPQLEKQFTETQRFTLHAALRDSWSPRWTTSQFRPGSDQSVENLNWGDYFLPGGWSTRQHVADAFVNTAGPLPSMQPDGADKLDPVTRRLVVGSSFDAIEREAPRSKLLNVQRSADGTLIRKEFEIWPELEGGDALIVVMLHRADLAAPAAPVLCLHQTTDDTRWGKLEPLGEAGDSELSYALDLARRGYVTLSVDYPGFGDSELDYYTCQRLGYESLTMKALWNHVRCIDWLMAQQETAGTRVACIGHSLGGTNALFLAALDLRVGCTICSAGFTAFSHYDALLEQKFDKSGDWQGALSFKGEGGWDAATVERGANLFGWSRKDKYMPWIESRFHNRADQMLFDFDDVIGAIAPRSLFISAPQADEVFQFRGVEKLLPTILSHYAAHENGLRCIAVHTPDYGHAFREQERQQAFAFLDAHMLETAGCVQTPWASARAAGP